MNLGRDDDRSDKPERAGRAPRPLSRALNALPALALLAFAAPVLAQPAPAPPSDYGPPINNEQAKAAAAAVVAEAQKNNWHMVVVVVAPDGSLVYLEKMDGAQNASVELAQGKARTAALYRRPSKAFADQYNAGNTAFLTFPKSVRPTASEGGLPLVIDGKLIGAIGVSGGTGQQDGTAASVGASALH